MSFVEGKYLKLEGGAGGADFVFDVEYGNLREGAKVNYLGGHKTLTFRPGGGRDWLINDDGTISSKHAPHLVLGASVEISANDLSGCWRYSSYPFFYACQYNAAENADEFSECGFASFCCGICSFPYFRHRRRQQKGKNSFYKGGNTRDVVTFLSKTEVDFGRYSRFCKGRKLF